jgi:hypothetical protein
LAGFLIDKVYKQKNLEMGLVSASTGAAGTDPEGGQAGRVSHVGNLDDLRSGVPVRQGFEFLGYKIKRGKQLRLPPGKIRSGARSG